MDWSNNPIKLRRAIDSLPKDATEAEIKAEYVKLGGMVSGDSTKVTLEVSEDQSSPETIVAKIKKAIKKNVSKPRVLVAKKKATKSKK